MLTTVLSPMEGTAKVAGMDIRSNPNGVGEKIGVVSQAMTLDVELSAWENMELYSKYYNVASSIRKERIKELLDVVGLADTKVRQTIFRDGLSSGGSIPNAHTPWICFWRFHNQCADSGCP
jgi:ABC-2 type transport system ATP-binding protein